MREITSFFSCGGKVDVWETDSKEKKKKLSGNVLYLDWDGSYTNVYIYQNSSNDAQNMHLL